MTVIIQNKRYILSQGQDNNMVYISEDNNKPVKRYFATKGTLRSVSSSIKRYPILWGNTIQRELA